MANRCGAEMFTSVIAAERKKTLPNLQILRAYAALSVVFFHVIWAAKSYGFRADVTENIGNFGASGVDVFFVISGFVMLYTQLESKRTVSNFLIGRFLRVVPLYWLLTLIIIVLYFILPSDVFRELEITTGWALTSLVFVSNAVSNKDPIIFVGWTLEWEMLFYLVFGVSLWFRAWLTSITVTVMALLTFAALAPQISSFVSNFILVEFIAGMAVALAFKRYGFTALGKTSLTLGFLLLLSSILILPQNNDLYKVDVGGMVLSREIIWGIPSMLIVYGAVTMTQMNTTIGRLLGDASYSIYLMQVPSISLFYKLASYFGMNINTNLLAIVCVLFTTIFGITSYLIVEKPLTQYLKNRIAN